MKPEEYEALAESVRKASEAGELVPADRFCCGEDELSTLVAEAAGAVGATDITWIREGDAYYLFSDKYMTSAFAAAAALGASGDSVRMIAATVRFESAAYPRPTSLETFYGRPFCLTAEETWTAVARMRMDSQYNDITAVHASDGAEFLFSCRHLNHDQAVSMAEWLAVTRYENP